MSLDYLAQEIRGSVPLIRRHLGGARWVRHDERQDALCLRV